MPHPVDLFKTVLAFKELHDVTRKFVATGAEAHMFFSPQGIPAQMPGRCHGGNPKTILCSLPRRLFSRALIMRA